jgi:hypothetical protein
MAPSLADGKGSDAGNASHRRVCVWASAHPRCRQQLHRPLHRQQDRFMDGGRSFEAWMDHVDGTASGFVDNSHRFSAQLHVWVGIRLVTAVVVETWARSASLSLYHARLMAFLSTAHRCTGTNVDGVVEWVGCWALLLWLSLSQLPGVFLDCARAHVRWAYCRSAP